MFCDNDPLRLFFGCPSELWDFRSWGFEDQAQRHAFAIFCFSALGLGPAGV